MRQVLAVTLLLALSVSPATAAGRLALLPLRNSGPAAPQVEWIAEGLPAYAGLLLNAGGDRRPLTRDETAAIATAWGPEDAPASPEASRLLLAAGAQAALVGTFQTQAGSLRLQVQLFPDIAAGAPALSFSLNGKIAQLGALASSLAELVTEALDGRFPRVIRPPLPSPSEFIPTLLEPSFGPKSPPETLAQNETFLLAALKIDPNNADAYAQLGTLYARNGLADKALVNLTTAVELSPKTPRYHWDRGVALYLQGQLEEALTEFLQSTVIDENFADGFIALGALHRRLGDAEASQTALERAVKARPDDPLALTALGVNAYLRRDRAGARALFEQARAADPRSSAAAVNLALIAWEEGNADAARKELERALAADPSSPEALNGLAILDGARGAADAAVAGFKRALEAGAPRRIVLYNLGTLQLLSGQLAEAATTLQGLLETEPAFLPARVNLAVIQLVRGRVEEAIAILAGAPEGSPAVALSSYNLALAHQLQGNSQQALVHYLRAVRSRSDLTEAHVNLGILFEGMGRTEKALAEYLKVLSSEENLPEIYTYLGQIYAKHGYLSMVEETIGKTTLVDPNLPVAWHALATSLEANDRPKAVVAWRQFLEVVRRDRNRGFWVPVAEGRLAALGAQ